MIDYDYDGAVFTNVGPRTSFEVLLGSFGLENDEKLMHIARTVNSIDLGEMPVDIAPGLEEILAGLREVHLADDALMASIRLHIINPFQIATLISCFGYITLSHAIWILRHALSWKTLAPYI